MKNFLCQQIKAKKVLLTFSYRNVNFSFELKRKFLKFKYNVTINFRTYPKMTLVEHRSDSLVKLNEEQD